MSLSRAASFNPIPQPASAAPGALCPAVAAATAAPAISETIAERTPPRTSAFQASILSQAQQLSSQEHHAIASSPAGRATQSAAGTATADEASPPADIDKPTETLTPYLYKFPRMKASKLQAALVDSNPERVKSLIASGADIEAKDEKFGFTALHFAVGETADRNDRKMLQATEVLLEAGADVQARAKDGRQPLHEHMGNGYDPISTDVIGLLLKHGAEINARDGIGMTPIHFAAAKDDANSIKIIDFLAKNGADVNATDDQGRTALHHVAEQYTGSQFPAEALLKAGADYLIKDNEGKTPVDIAKAQFGNWRVAKLFDQKIDPQAAAAKEALFQDRLGDLLVEAYNAERGMGN